MNNLKPFYELDIEAGHCPNQNNMDLKHNKIQSRSKFFYYITCCWFDLDLSKNNHNVF